MKTPRKRRKPILGRSSPELSPAAEVIGNNVDLLTQILPCLPVKSLMRFKSVSKDWLSLISDSKFAINQSRRNPRPSISGLFLCWDYRLENPKCVSLQGDPNRPTLAFLEGAGGIQFGKKIIHSCNGLLLCEYSLVSRKRFTYHYVVCNPTTQTYTLVPESAAFSSGCIPGQLHALLAFDPSTTPHYKVVFLGFCRHFEIDIYCSESASWKQIRLAPNEGDIRAVVFCGGAIHCLSRANVISRFDVLSEKMIDPPGVFSLDKIRYFGECGGRLILIQTCKPKAMGLRVFEMDNDYCRWIKRYRVNLGPLISEFPEMVCEVFPYSVLCVVKGENEKDYALVLAIPGKVISYDLSCKTWNVLRDVAPGQSFPYSYPYATAHPYIESLSPVCVPCLSNATLNT